MKTLNRYLKESLNDTVNEAAKNSLGFPKDTALMSWGWKDVAEGNMGVKEYMIDCYGSPNSFKMSDAEFDGACKKLQKYFDKYISGHNQVFLGNWDPDYADDPDEAWEYFYDETGYIDGKDCGIVMFEDGNDGEFEILEFKSSSGKKAKETKDFIEMLLNNPSVYMAKIF